jgi:HK97 family phage prohead protease
MPFDTPRLSPAVELKFAAPPAETGVFVGYGSTFGGPPDAYGDVIAPGAFAKSLADHRERGTMPALLWSHDPAEPVGIWTELREDRNGLRVAGKLALEVRRGAEAHALMKAGALGLSIGYIVRDAGRDSGNRVLKQVELLEISVVSMPANHGARITGVKSGPAVNDIRDARAYEKFLRDAGFSRAFAVAATNHGFKTAAGLRDADDTVAEMVRSIRERADLLNQIVKATRNGIERT